MGTETGMAKQHVHDLCYLQSRVWEEMERCYRYGRHFSLILFRADNGPRAQIADCASAALAVMVSRLRSTDIVARVSDDTIAALLVETDPPGAARAVERMREELQTYGGSWVSRSLSFPADSPAIEALPFLEAA